MTQLYGSVGDSALSAGGEGSSIGLNASKRGELYIADFYLRMALQGRAYQVRAGTITTHLTGDVEITDTAAEASADAASGTTIIPVYANIHIEALGGTVPIVTLKSVGAVSTAGTAFVPLPLKIGGAAATSTARVSAAGGVTVAAELATTTRRHFTGTLVTVDAPQIAVWEPRTPPVLTGPACLYVQVAATTTGPNYYANFDYIELSSTNV